MATEKKHCWCCGGMLPPSSFSKDASRRDGLMNICKACRAAKRKKKSAGRKAGRPAKNSLRDSFGRKQCQRCLKWRHESEFHKGSRLSSDGLDPRCKFCQGGRTHGDRDEEVQLALKRLAGSHASSGNRKSDRRLNLHRDSDVTPELLWEIWQEQEGRCPVSGVGMTYIRGRGKVPTNVSIDRIDSRKGYTKGNIHLVCYQANMMKGLLGPRDLMFWCRAILNTNWSPPGTEKSDE